MILTLKAPNKIAADNILIFSSPGRSPGRAIVLSLSALALALALGALANCLSFHVKDGQAVLSGELSYPCDRSCLL